jgi:DNA repair exonuclease SbcCD ATPase subunit
MASEMEELLGEAATLCGDLMEEIADAVEAADQIKDNAKTVIDKVESEVGDARKKLTVLTSQIANATKSLEEAADKAVEDLDAATTKAGDVKDDVGELADKVEAGGETLEKAAEDLQEVVKKGVESLEEALKKYGDKVKTTLEAIDEDVKETKDAVEKFGQELDGARDGLRSQQEAWATALDDLIDEATEQANDLIKALGDGADAQARALLNMVNGAVIDHNEAMDTVDQKFTTEAEQSLADAMSPLAASIAEVSRLAEQGRTQISQKGNEILNRLVTLVPQMQEIEAELRSVEGMND